MSLSHGTLTEKKPALNHFDSEGQAHMVDVSSKADSLRIATARGRIKVSPQVYETIVRGTAAKGDVLGVARLAGIMGAKKTSELIPLCHPLPITGVSVEFTLLPEDCAVEAAATARITGKTGVEMEALTAVSTALLTIYDMCKALDKSMEITDIRLEEKSGGKSGHYKRAK